MKAKAAAPLQQKVQSPKKPVASKVETSSDSDSSDEEPGIKILYLFLIINSGEFLECFL